MDNNLWRETVLFDVHEIFSSFVYFLWCYCGSQIAFFTLKRCEQSLILSINFFQCSVCEFCHLVEVLESKIKIACFHFSNHYIDLMFLVLKSAQRNILGLDHSAPLSSAKNKVSVKKTYQQSNYCKNLGRYCFSTIFKLRVGLVLLLHLEIVHRFQTNCWFHT